MNKIVDHLFVFEGEGVLRDFTGNYTEYRERKEKEDKQKTKLPKATKEKPKQEIKEVSSEVSTKKKISFKEKTEYENLEKEIEKLETEKTKLTELLNSATDNHDEINEWSQRIGEIIKELDKKGMRWLELSELM